MSVRSEAAEGGSSPGERALDAGVGAFQGTFLRIYSYPGIFVPQLVSSLWFGAISVSCLLVHYSSLGPEEMSGRDLLMGLNSFLPSCLCFQPRSSLSADIRSFSLGNPKDRSHTSNIRLGTEESPALYWEVLREGMYRPYQNGGSVIEPASPPSTDFRWREPCLLHPTGVS